MLSLFFKFLFVFFSFPEFTSFYLHLLMVAIFRLESSVVKPRTCEVLTLDTPQKQLLYCCLSHCFWYFIQTYLKTVSNKSYTFILHLMHFLKANLNFVLVFQNLHFAWHIPVRTLRFPAYAVKSTTGAATSALHPCWHQAWRRPQKPQRTHLLQLIVLLLNQKPPTAMITKIPNL